MPATTVRAYPPAGGLTSTFVSPSGAAAGANPSNPPGIVSYVGANNGFVDALFADSTGLQALLGWTVLDSVVGSGVTGNRLAAPGYKGKFFLDTTLGQFIWSDGAIWRKFDGTAA